MSRRLWVIVLLVTVCAAVGDDQKPAPAIKDINARTAEIQYQQAILRLEADFHRQAGAARQKLIGELAAAQKEATKRGDLEDAVRIRDRVAELSEVQDATRPRPLSELATKRSRLTKRLGGTTWSWFPHVKPPRITFDDDGTCFWGESKVEARWVAIDDHNLLIQQKDLGKLKAGYCYLLVFDERLAEYHMFPLGPTKKEDGAEWLGVERK